MDRQVRLGFVGVGNMGQAAHLRNYAALPGCEVVAIAELRPELARAVASRYDIPRVYTSASELLARENIDGIVAIQQFQRHGLVLPDLYRAGLPVLTEKPLAASVAVGERLLAALEAGGSWHMVGYHKRCDPASVYARREIARLRATGELGALRYVRITMPAGDWIAGGFGDIVRSEEPVPDEASDPPAEDMDAATYQEYVRFVNYYIHQVNLLRYLLGEPYAVTHADRGGVLLVAESASGVTGVIEMTPYQTTVDWQESALAAFERGYVRLDLPAPLARNRPGRVEVLRDPGGGAVPETVSPHLPWSHAMYEQAAAFVRAIRGEAPPPCEAAEALEDLRVARAYVRLWREGGL
jgi:predicted dehydrogenase